MLCGDLNGKGTQKREDIRIRKAASLCCTVETRTTLESNSTPKKPTKKENTLKEYRLLGKLQIGLNYFLIELEGS